MWYKNFRHKKLQTAIIAIIVTLSALLLNASISMLTSLDEPMEELKNECESPQIIAYPYSKDKAFIDQMADNIKSIDHVTDVQEINAFYLGESFKKGDIDISSYSEIAEYNEKVYKNVRVIEGTLDINNYKENECAVPACISNEYDVKIGDTLTFGIENDIREYKVVCIYSDPYDMSTAFDSRILVKKLPAVSKISNFLFVYTDGLSSKQLVSEYNKQFGNFGATVYSIEAQIDNSLLSAHIVGGIFLGVGIIMLIVSCIVIYFMVSNALLSDSKKIAIYKTMGYTYHDILSMYLRFYAVVVGIGTVLGVIGSVFVSNLVLDSIFKNIGAVTKFNPFYPGILTCVGTTAFVLAVIYLIMRKMKNIKPVYALSGMSNRNTKKSYKGNLDVAFSPAGIALRNFTRNKRGALGILITSVVTIFAINFAVVSVDVANNMEDTNDYWFSFDRSDFVIGVNSAKSLKETEQAIKQNSKVASYNFNTIMEQSRALLDYEEGMENSVIYPSVYESYDTLNLPVIEGRNPENENEVALATVIADNLHKSVGDYINLTLAEDKKVSLLITGTYQTYMNMGETCRMTGDVFTKNNVDFHYSSISVYIKDGENREEVMNELKKTVPQTDTFTVREKCYESIMKMIADPQKAGIPPVMILIVIIGAVNIFSIILLKNAFNKKTNQIYKSIGYSSKELIYANLIYVGVIAIVSDLIAVPALLLTYEKIITAALSLFAMKEYPMNANYMHLLIANLVVILVFVVSTLLSSRSIRKINVRDLVID